MPVAAPLLAKNKNYTDKKPKTKKLYTMKAKKLFMLMTAIFTLTACSDGGDDGGGGNEPKPNPEPTPKTVNNNKNTTGPAEAQYRLEFPKLKGGNSETIIHSTAQYGMTYALEWDHQKRATRWVCWRMDATNRQEKYSRSTLYPNGDPWAYDPLVPENEQQATYNELSKSFYPDTGSYYQKGHICASQDRIYDPEANRQTFYMTNIMPQVGKFNEKLWQKLESEVRKWGDGNQKPHVNPYDTLYICKGGTIDNPDYILGTTIGNHIVPKYFFMALLKKTPGKYEAIAFLMIHADEDRQKDDLKNYAIKVDRLEEFTGIDFFCNLPDDIEDDVESKLTLSEWFK